MALSAATNAAERLRQELGARPATPPAPGWLAGPLVR